MHKKNSSNKKSLIIKLVILVFILIAGASTLFFFDKSQDIRQQAWIGKNDVGSTCLNSSCDENAKESDSFTSSQDIYKINLANSGWKIGEVPKTSSKKNEDPSFFVFRNEFGFATIFLNAAPMKDKDSLEKAISNKYLAKETINLGKRSVVRYKFQEEILGKKAIYYEYIITGKDHYIEAEVRSTETAISKNKINAFLNSLEFVEETENVKGASTKKTTFAESEITELTKPSVGNVLHIYCKDIKINSNVNTMYLQKSYPFCGGSYGSGFVVNESGLIATNGHVVMSYPEQDLIGGISSGNPTIAKFLVDLVREASFSQGLVTTPEEGLVLTAKLMQNPSTAQVVIKSIYELLDQNAIEITPTTEKYFVNLGQEAFEFSDKSITPYNIDNFVKEKTAIFAAEKIGINYANLFSKAVIFDQEKPSGSDVALLQVSNKNEYSYPSLKLGDATALKEGDSILVIGFPGVVSGSESGSSLLDYSSSSTKASITRGIVSSMKKDFEGNNLIQTDATIGHGNSGGPAFNDKGEVIGIATYGIGDDAGNFSFLRDIDDLEQLAKEKNSQILQTGDQTYLDWETALNLYWGNHFTKSLNFLSKVQESYPIHPTVEKIAESAEKGIDEGKDVDLLFGIQKTTVYALGGGLGFLILITIIVIIIKMRKTPEVITQSSPIPNQSMGNMGNVNQPIDNTIDHNEQV